MRSVLFTALFIISFGSLCGCSENKTTPAASPAGDSGDTVSTLKGAGRLPGPAAPK